MPRRNSTVANLPEHHGPCGSGRAPHPVRKACLEAAVKLAALMPTRIVREPDMADANALIDDLDAICAIVDPVIAAIGQYAESNLGRLDRSLFADQLRGALEGNAMFEIEQAARRLVGQRAAGAAEAAAEFRRG
jgi:hypothetical protein